jgi:hypothetical protein
MGKLTPEAGGDQGTRHNQDHEHFKTLKEEGRLRPDRRRPKEIFRVFYGKPPEGEVPGDASKYLSDPHFSGFAKRGRMRPAVYGGHERPSRERKSEGNQPTPQNPGEQRGEAEQSQTNPAEQQAAERLGKPPPKEAVVETLDPEVEKAIRAYAMGDSEEEAQLREQAKNDPDLRHDLLHPGGSLAYFTPPIPHIVLGSEDNSS